MINLLIFTLFFMVVIFGYRLFLNEQLSKFLDQYISRTLISQLREYKYLGLAVLYLFFAIVICIRTTGRYVQYLDLVSRSLNTLVDEEAEVANFPTELKELEISLKDVKYSISRNEQMAREAEQQKTDLIMYLAHDLKTPLTSVIGYLALIQENPTLPVEQRAKYVKITLEKAYRLEQLINEFFDITRLNLQTMILAKGRVDLTMMLYQIADEFYPVFAEKGLTAVLDIEAGLRLQGDSDKLVRVFDNLLRNASSYSYENTCVCIEASREEEGIRVSVKNQGDEIPPERQKQLFHKFYRGDSSRGTRGGGAGLGLAIAKDIVELHGGRIGVLCQGRETEFRVFLPGAYPAYPSHP